MKPKTFLLGQLLASACVLAPYSVRAQVAAPAPGAPAASGGDVIEQIVVTAQRRSESLQQVPIAVSALNSDQLTEHGIADSTSLAMTVPNLDISQNGTVLSLYMRGVGSNASDPNDEASVATYVDGVYIASPLGNMFDFNNIERVEVLKGPQGTLIGRNATGGVIQVITRDPDQTPSGEASVTYGNYNTVGGTAYLTTGITPDLAADIAAVYSNNLDGYGTDINLHNPIMRDENLGLRSKWMWTPDATTKVRLAADYTMVRSDGTNYQLAPGVIGADGVTGYPGPYKTDTNERNLDDVDNWGLALTVDKDFGGARLVSISAYREITGQYDLDEDSTPAPVVNSFIHQLARTFSQELQLLSPNDPSSKLQWTLGAYYFNATYAYDPITIGGLAAGGPDAAENIFGTQYTRSASIYGQATYEILPETRLTAGLRYTDEQQNVKSDVQVGGVVVLTPPNLSQTTDRPTWRLALDHQFTPDILGYVSYNRGMKSGGYNLITPGAPGYRSEILDAYEIGVKSDLFDHAARINIAGFYYDYNDIQVQNIQAGGVNTVNAASANIKGIDGDFKFVPLHNLTLSTNVGYTYGTYDNFENATYTPPSPLDGPQVAGDASGNRLINSPRWTVSGSIDYTIPVEFGQFVTDFTISHTGMTFVAADNRLTNPAHTVANASITWDSRDDDYSVQLWGRNIFDERYYASRVETAVGDLQYLAPPATFGVTLTTRF